MIAQERDDSSVSPCIFRYLLIWIFVGTLCDAAWYHLIISLIVKAYVILYLNETVKLLAIMRQLSRLLTDIPCDWMQEAVQINAAI